MGLGLIGGLVALVGLGHLGLSPTGAPTRPGPIPASKEGPCGGRVGRSRCGLRFQKPLNNVGRQVAQPGLGLGRCVVVKPDNVERVPAGRICAGGHEDHDAVERVETIADRGRRTRVIHDDASGTGDLGLVSGPRQGNGLRARSGRDPAAVCDRRRQDA